MAICRPSWRPSSTPRTQARARMPPPFPQPSCGSRSRCERPTPSGTPYVGARSFPSIDRWVGLPDLFALVRVDRWVGWTRARPVDVNSEAARVRGGFNELEMHRGGQILEQGEPGAECGRLDHES